MTEEAMREEKEGGEKGRGGRVGAMDGGRAGWRGRRRGGWGGLREGRREGREG